MSTSLLAATVHFVGIIAFMPQPGISTARSGAQDQGVRVASIQTSANTPSAQSGVLAVIPQDFPSPLPEHTAMIIYHATDYVSSTGLQSSLLHRDGLKYVPLHDGDLVTFDTGGATNPPAGVPTALPHHPARSRTNQLALLASYDPADRSHAAVVAIPAGTVSVCEDNHRSDTSIALNVRGSFVIKVKTTSGTKTLTLKSGAEVSIVNVPFSYADTLVADHQVTNHYLEYCVMAGIATDRSHCPPPSYIPSASVCAWPGRDMLVAQSNAGHYKPKMGASADCSNTQWP